MEVMSKMAILIDETNKVLVQGITGEEGRKATLQMKAYGTNIVCGVTPGKGGQVVEEIPVYSSVKQAKEMHPELNTSVLYVPPSAAKDACFEALENGIKLVVCITETIPLHDTLEMLALARRKKARLIGPSTIGVLSTGKAKLGSLGGSKNDAFIPGNVGIISKSGGLCNETALLLKAEDIGISSVVSIGGDTIAGSDYCDILRLFEKDPETKAVVMLGEVGGEYEHLVAEMLKNKEFTKPLIAFISGTFASSMQNVALGHAGAIVEGERGTRESKMKALEESGAKVVNIHHELVDSVKETLE
jgi:succinyl-CoA synthetase alpha subunit